MPLIPFPNIPKYSGVPPIPRIAPGIPAINLSLDDASKALAAASSFADSWGIFTYPGGEALYTPNQGGVLSTFAVSYLRQMQISDFPIEANATGQGAAFASFNKVWQPANPIVTFAISGSDTEMSAFLTALDVACQSTQLYNVTTPDASYPGYSIESYSYQRTAQHGATMLIVEISLKEILQVSPSYANLPQPTQINDPQSPSAAPQQNSGQVQSQIYSPSQGNGQQALENILGFSN